MKSVTMALGLVCVLPFWARADDTSATQPAAITADASSQPQADSQSSDSQRATSGSHEPGAIPPFGERRAGFDGGFGPGQGTGSGMGFGGMGRRPFGAMNGQDTQGQWEQYKDEILAFMRENSPNRLRIWSNMRYGPAKFGMRLNMLRKWMTLQELERNGDVQIHDVQLEQFKLEDQIVGLAERINQTSAGAEKESLKHDIKDRANQLFDLQIKERQIRIARMQKLLDTAEKRIDDDTKNRDQIIDERIDKLLRSRFVAPPAATEPSGQSSSDVPDAAANNPQ